MRAKKSHRREDDEGSDQFLKTKTDNTEKVTQDEGNKWKAGIELSVWL
jgi:hypothetical protein